MIFTHKRERIKVKIHVTPEINVVLNYTVHYANFR